MEQSHEHKLAFEIAEALDDMKSIDLHISFAKKYAEPFLKEMLALVLNTPARKIKRTRAAYFTYLVLKHNGDYSRN